MNPLKMENIKKNTNEYIILLIMSPQPAKFWGEESWLANLWEGLNVKRTLEV